MRATSVGDLGREAASDLGREAASDLGREAASEWSALVATAVVGTDRRLPPPPAHGWEAWGRASDPAVAVLDRAAAVVAARRAGGCPADAGDRAVPPPAPVDDRPPCPTACAARLGRVLAGEQPELLGEWLHRCDRAGVQLPWAVLPTLLLRGRRDPGLDATVRRLARGRAEWLAAVVPELGVAARPTSARAGAPSRSARATGRATPSAAGPEERPAPAAAPDPAAVVAGIVGLFADGAATWAAAPQLRAVVATLDPAWLPRLVAQLSQLAFHAPSERTRAEVIALAEFRHELHREFDTAERPPDRTTGAPR